jgi:hypothetical protein
MHAFFTFSLKQCIAKLEAVIVAQSSLAIHYNQHYIHAARKISIYLVS